MTKSVFLGIEGLGPGEIIGGGGSSTVYRATRLAVGDQVAVKILLRSLSSESQRRHFEREAGALAELSECEGIIAVLDHGETDRAEPFLAMPLLDGSAESAIRSGPVDWAQALDWTASAARAVHQAHCRGILHRDIKPANLLLTEAGDVFVSDFGIASLVDTSQSQSRGVFTPAYAPPEVLSGARGSVRSDIYSLAATFAALVMGRPPFAVEPRDHWTAEALRIRDDPAPDLAEFGVPEPIAKVVAEAMSKDSAQRPSSAAEFASALDTAARVAITGDPTTIDPQLVDTLAGAASSADADDLVAPSEVVDSDRVTIAHGERVVANRDSTNPGPSVDPVAARPWHRAKVVGGVGVAVGVIVGGLFAAGLVGSQPAKAGDATRIDAATAADDPEPTPKSSPVPTSVVAPDPPATASVQVGDTEFVNGAEILDELQERRDGLSPGRRSVCYFGVDSGEPVRAAFCADDVAPQRVKALDLVPLAWGPGSDAVRVKAAPDDAIEGARSGALLPDELVGANGRVVPIAAVWSADGESDETSEPEPSALVQTPAVTPTPAGRAETPVATPTAAPSPTRAAVCASGFSGPVDGQCTRVVAAQVVAGPTVLSCSSGSLVGANCVSTVAAGQTTPVCPAESDGSSCYGVVGSPVAAQCEAPYSTLGGVCRWVMPGSLTPAADDTVCATVSYGTGFIVRVETSDGHSKAAYCEIAVPGPSCHVGTMVGDECRETVALLPAEPICLLDGYILTSQGTCERHDPPTQTREPDTYSCPHGATGSPSAADPYCRETAAPS